MKGVKFGAASKGKPVGINHFKSSKSKKIVPVDDSKRTAELQFYKILKALKEVEKIEVGRIKPKSLDGLLDEF